MDNDIVRSTSVDTAIFDHLSTNIGNSTDIHGEYYGPARINQRDVLIALKLHVARVPYIRDGSIEQKVIKIGDLKQEKDLVSSIKSRHGAVTNPLIVYKKLSYAAPRKKD